VWALIYEKDIIAGITQLNGKHSYFFFVVHNRPADPAVIPTTMKKPNSTRSLEPGGIELIIVDKSIMNR